MERRTKVLITMLLACALALFGVAPVGLQAAPTCSDEGVFKDGKCERVFKFKIHADLPEYSFRVVWTPGNFITLDRIEVMRGDDPKVLQKLTCEDTAAPLLLLEAPDVNFDGYNDLVFLADAGATGNTSSMVWLFDPKQNTFVAHPEFRDLTSMNADPKTERIYTHAKGGMAGMIYVDETYAWRNGKLEQVEIESQDQIGISDYMYKLAKKREGANLVIVREEINLATDLAEGGAKPLCGPLGPPRTCGPEAAVIGFTMAEADRDPERMVAYYANQVTWNGAAKDKATLRTTHADYLKKIEDYKIELADFHQTLAPDGNAAVVEAQVSGEYHEKGKPGKTFKIVKRFRLIRQADAWLIDCEEVSKYLDNTKGKTGNACQLK